MTLAYGSLEFWEMTIFIGSIFLVIFLMLRNRLFSLRQLMYGDNNNDTVKNDFIGRIVKVLMKYSGTLVALYMLMKLFMPRFGEFRSEGFIFLQFLGMWYLITLVIVAFEIYLILFAEILSRGISYQLKQGLYREYVPRTESLPTMRGKIDITKTIKHRIQCQQILSCEFDELSENNIFNQILKTTISILLQGKIVAKERKNKLKKVLPFFVNINTIEPSIVKWNTLYFQRNNQTYKMLMNICYFILEGLLQTTEDGKYHMATFSDEYMHRLYEKFVYF